MTSLLDRDPEEIRAAVAQAEAEGDIEALEAIDAALSLALEDALSDEAATYTTWLRALYAPYVRHPFAEHHHAFWAWIWSIEAEKQPNPSARVNVWPRGGAKSTSAELAVVALGQRRTRRYVLYCCASQDRANDHVQNIARLLESPALARRDPQLASREVGKYGTATSWRRSRVRTASGLIVDAVGIDTATRGVKMDEVRPDLIVLDDIDDVLDSIPTVEKKIETLTHTILPTGQPGVRAVLALQNLVHEESVFSRIVDGRAGFLSNALISGPVKAVSGLALEVQEGRSVITAGTAAWAGQSIEQCQADIDEFGPTAWLAEAQHDVRRRGGGIFDEVLDRIIHCTREQVPALRRVTVWCDPAVTDKDQSDSQAVQCDGVAASGTIYRLRSWERRASPVQCLLKALTFAYEEGALEVGVETDQGGDTWESVFREAHTMVLDAHPEWKDRRRVRFAQEKAGAGYGPKAHRGAQMLVDYEKPNRIVHVLGDHEILERGLGRFPRVKPYDLVDAAFWSWHFLREGTGPAKVASAAGRSI